MAERKAAKQDLGNGFKRRQRRQQAPVEEIAAPAVPSKRRQRRAIALRWQQWMRELLPSIGLSSTFRAYLFVGSILAILAYLLYNESIIRELRNQEKRNVDLYAELISLSARGTDEQSIAIFTGITTNPNIDFPRIRTDHRGKIIEWKGVELSAADTTSFVSRLWQRMAFWREEEVEVIGDTLQILQRIVEEMDAINPPKVFYLLAEVQGYLHCAEERLVISDSQGEIIEWGGNRLPAREDTTAAARAGVRAFLQGDASEPLPFKIPVGTFSYLHFDGRNAIITDNKGEVVGWQGERLPAREDTTAAARTTVRAFLQGMGDVSEPVPFEIPAETFIHYGESGLVRRISRSIFIQIIALLLFLLVGYVGFRNIKRSEQRSIWVGMAKETAHQLGTPLSSLAGWLELIGHELDRGGSEETAGPADLERIGEMAGEMQKDMQRLTQIASRFSQIGSVPELKMGDVVAILEETAAYFRNRGPQFGRYEIQIEVPEPIPLIPLNADLVGWIFENLFKNAMDAIEHEAGRIDIHIALLAEGQGVQIAFQDNGRGIDAEHVARIFDPGFSTKKRGWGLGLAFVKRIVEEYHGGRVGVVQSAPGEGTTFEITLPLRDA
jgi:two-component system, NtrC family, sensor histidine kinase KinB